MSAASKSIHRATISLGIPRKNADVILYASNIVEKMTNNPAFPTPTPTLAALTAASAGLKWSNGFSFTATFDGEFSDVTRSYAGKAVARYQW